MGAPWCRMAGNRVEELEETVRELEATVSGLTDELVECKERIQHLEAEVEPDPSTDIIEGRPTRGKPTQTGGPSEGAADPAPDGGDAAAADESKGGASEGTDEEASTDGDDIIVA